jgi:hypothetical protein
MSMDPIVAARLQREVQRTHPDYVVYVPRSLDSSTQDTGNEHFLVSEHPQGGLFAVWTQSSYEGKPDQRVVFARSRDHGQTWTPPKILAGPGEGRGIASWQFPLIAKSGRIYVCYNRYTGVHDLFMSTCGVMGAIYSDDGGETWSREQIVPMPRTQWDSRDPKIPANWIIWQKPQRFFGGPYFAGFTRWVSPEVSGPRRMDVWWSNASVVEFMRFDNVDANPEPRDLQITYCATNGHALRYGHIGHPDVSVVQEPAIVPLPDGRLFCVMRTNAGHAVWSESPDRGTTWTQPVALRQTDDRLPLPHPCSPCPIYEVAPGEYIFLFHNHDGHMGGWGPMKSEQHRRPIWLVRGLFRPGAKQPVWFSEPQFLMDNGGVPMLRADLAMYASTTPTDEGLILWYPERKFFLLGKHIRRSWLAEMAVPERGGER